VGTLSKPWVSIDTEGYDESPKIEVGIPYLTCINLLSELLDKIMKTAEYNRFFFARYHTDKQISKKLCSVFKEVHPLIDTYEGKKKK
jgi:hypothetical protein